MEAPVQQSVEAKCSTQAKVHQAKRLNQTLETIALGGINNHAHLIDLGEGIYLTELHLVAGNGYRLPDI